MDTGEKPRNLYDLLHQGEWWINRAKEWVHIAEMDLSYAENLYNWLCSRAGHYGAWVGHYAQHETFRMAYIADGPLGPGGDAACDAFESAMDEIWEEGFEAQRHTDRWFPKLELVQAVKLRRDELRAEEARRKALEAMVQAGGI
jgi:hypothetical protein